MAGFWPIGTEQIIRIVSYPIRKKSRFWLFCMWSVKEMYHALLPKADCRDKGRGHDRRLRLGSHWDLLYAYPDYVLKTEIFFSVFEKMRVHRNSFKFSFARLHVNAKTMEVRLHALQGMLCMLYDIIRPHDSLRIQPFLLAPRFSRGKPLGETSVVARSKEKRLNSQANNTKTIRRRFQKSPLWRAFLKRCVVSCFRASENPVRIS